MKIHILVGVNPEGKWDSTAMEPGEDAAGRMEHFYDLGQHIGFHWLDVEIPEAPFDAWEGSSPDTGDTVHVRILVAIDECGEWSSLGYSEITDHQYEIETFGFFEFLGDQLSFHWIEADVPLPVISTLRGVVDPQDAPGFH